MRRGIFLRSSARTVMWAVNPCQAAVLGMRLSVSSILLGSCHAVVGGIDGLFGFSLGEIA